MLLPKINDILKNMTSRKRTTLHRRLLLFFIGVSVLLILAFTLLLSVFGINGKQEHSVKSQLSMELDILKDSIETDFGRLSVVGISVAEDLTAKSNRFFSENQIKASQLSKHPELLEPLLSEYMETLLHTANTRYCGGAFVLLDASVREASDTGKAGIFLKKTQPTATEDVGVDIHYLRGPAQLARENNLMLMGQWQMEYDISEQQFWHDVIQTANEHPELDLSRLYYWSGRVMLKNNSETGFLLCVPLRSLDNTVFGICGIEVSDRLFKSLYTPTNGAFEEIFAVMSPICAEGLCTSKGLLAGNQYLSGTRWNDNLIETDSHDGFIHYSGNGQQYSGKTDRIKLYPEGSPYKEDEWTIAILMPQSILHKAVNENQYIFNYIVIVLLIVAVLASIVIAGLYIKPVNEAFEQIRSKDYIDTTVIKRIPEIDDLFAFLAQQEREQDELLSHHKKRSEVLQDKVEKLHDEKSALQTQMEQVQADNSRLAYRRKDEVDPDSYAMFVESLNTLSKREKEVFDLYVEGKTAKEIAELLSISDNGLKYHNKNIYSKLGVSSRKELLRYVAILKHEQ